MQNLSANLKLEDLNPKEANFAMGDYPGKIFTLKRFSMNDRIFVNQRWPDPKEVEKIFSELRLAEISEIAFRLLKEKEFFKDLEDFREHLVTVQDIHAVLSGVLETIGVSEPLMNEMAAALTAGKKTKPTKSKKAKRIGRR